MATTSSDTTAIEVRESLLDTHCVPSIRLVGCEVSGHRDESEVSEDRLSEIIHI